MDGQPFDIRDGLLRIGVPANPVPRRAGQFLFQMNLLSSVARSGATTSPFIDHQTGQARPDSLNTTRRG
jgi:hypothetical protein